MRLRAGLVTIVYHKALRLSNSARQQSTVSYHPHGDNMLHEHYRCLIIALPKCRLVRS